jgi:hypothetical protein
MVGRVGLDPRPADYEKYGPADCTVCTGGSVHEPVHVLPRRSPDASYRTLPPSGRSARARARWHKAAQESEALLTAEPLDFDYQHEVIRRVHQERDQASAVRAEMQ